MIRGIVKVQNLIAGVPFFMELSVHSATKALQDFFFVEFSIYTQSSRNELMMNQPINVKENNQHGLDNGLQFSCLLWYHRRSHRQGDDAVCHWEDI